MLQTSHGALDAHQEDTEQANNNRVDRLRPILLFDLKANMHNERLGKEATQQAEECHGIAPEQYGSREKRQLVFKL
eukprot:11636853-Ditylum_brightwellii.AAC.1